MWLVVCVTVEIVRSSLLLGWDHNNGEVSKAAGVAQSSGVALGREPSVIVCKAWPICM